MARNPSPEGSGGHSLLKSEGRAVHMEEGGWEQPANGCTLDGHVSDEAREGRVQWCSAQGKATCGPVALPESLPPVPQARGTRADSGNFFFFGQNTK